MSGETGSPFLAAPLVRTFVVVVFVRGVSVRALRASRCNGPSWRHQRGSNRSLRSYAWIWIVYVRSGGRRRLEFGRCSGSLELRCTV